MEWKVMRKSGIVYFVVVSVFMIFVLAGGVWAQEDDVDKPGDGPPEGSSVQKSLALSAASLSSNTKTFRTDSGPELDFYQPCNGGDNLIDFDINVNNVDISSITSATLTLAVWDVDFSCGSACSGYCERDTVYINGYRLTTPVEYLTGANQQWSTVTFNVDPSWIVDGDNAIDIYIDTLGRGCWCVTCDWGELALELEDTPEIEDIEITPDNPETTKDVTFTAKLKNMDGYEVVKVQWSGDIKPWWMFWALDGNPLTVQPPAGTHGKDKNVTATLKYREIGGGGTGTHSMSKKFDLFFEKKGDDDNDGQPNWFEYWIRDNAVPNMAGVHYDAALSGWGESRWNGIFLSPKAGDQHYSSAIILNTHFGAESFGGPTVIGIDCAAEVVAHERYHAWVNNQWLPLGSFFLKTDSDKGVPSAGYNDQLPDFYETATSHTKNDDTDTYDLEHKKHSTYKTYGDNEYMAMRTGNGARGTASNDWANPGKQSNPPYGSLSSTSSTLTAILTNLTLELVDAGFTGNNSDEGIDTGQDGINDLLRVIAEVNVVNGGVFDVVAFLKDNNDNVITFVNTTFTLTAGLQNITFDFDGVAISEHGVDGPFNVNISLHDEYGNEIEQQIYTTALYEYANFKVVSEIVGNFAESTPDDNGNGLFDTLDINVDVDVVTAGDITLEAYLYTSTETPISYASAEANLPVGQHTLTLSFDGMAIRQSRVDGPYLLRSLALFEGEDRTDFIYDAYATSAYSHAAFEVGDAEFASAGTFSDQGIDLDSDGLYDLLRIEVAADILQAGSYAIVGRLFDAEGNSIDDVTLEVNLTAGQQAINLDFSGLAIWLNRKNGPYELRYAFLYDSEGSLADSLPNAYVTSAYNYTEFERPDVALTGNYSDEAIDQNGDGVYEYLKVDVEVIVANAGNYAMNARLMDEDENEIVWASTTAWLPADQVQTLQLYFSGASIYNHDVKGPYYVRDVYVYNMSNTSLSDYVYDAYVTQNHWPVENEAPIADAGPDQIVECACNTTSGTQVTLDGTGSSDADGDPLSYTWTGLFIESPASGPTPTVTLQDGCPGDYVITLVVNDGTEDSEPDEVVISVVAPELSVSVEPGVLWPPNHKMVEVFAAVIVSDGCDGDVDWTVSVTSNEDDNGKGDGNRIGDIEVTDDGRIFLRAERSGKGDGRVYTITYEAEDASGNTSEATATVIVPHNQP